MAAALAGCSCHVGTLSQSILQSHAALHGDVAENNGIYHGIVKAILEFELIMLLFPSKKPGFCLYPLYPSRVELNKKDKTNVYIYKKELAKQ